ncbi:MAG: cytochrome oxidase putative small subunit CydP [Hydrogenophilaceae bacterium]
MIERKPVSLRREIVLLLLIKLTLIIAIKLVFFSDPVRPGSEGTADALLNHPTLERNASHE